MSLPGAETAMGEGMLTSESTPVPRFARIPELKTFRAAFPTSCGPVTTLCTDHPGPRARSSLACRAPLPKLSQLKTAEVSLTPVRPRTRSPACRAGRTPGTSADSGGWPENGVAH